MGSSQGTGGFFIMPRGGSRPGAGRPKKKFEIDTGRSIFSPAQREAFEKSPCVASTTEKTISFTREFKELFWQRYCDGVQPEKIFSDAGMDPEEIGVSRIWGLISTLRKQKEEGREFSSGRLVKPGTTKQPRFPSASKEAKNAAELARLSHSVAYLTQELEFIKKIILAANGGKSK
jgi:hypothetical protein